MRDVIDLRINALFPDAFEAELAERFASVVSRSSLRTLFDYQPSEGMPGHLTAGAAWLAGSGLPHASEERLLVISGAQHALLVVLSALTRLGDVLLVEELTYTGIIYLAEQLHLELKAVPMDEDGLIPEALEQARAETGSRFLYCMPSGHNPTASVMPAGRRQAVADVVERGGLTVIEDDTYGFLVEDVPPLAALVPDSSYYITGTSKSLLPGFRVAYLLSPDRRSMEPLRYAICSSTMMCAPAMVEMATAVIVDGLASRIVDWKRRVVATRQDLVRQALTSSLISGDRRSLHLWLRLPKPWRNETFVDAAEEEGVLLCSAEAFSVAPQTTTKGVRLCLGSVSGTDELIRVLDVIEGLTARGPTRRTIV